MLLVRTGPVPFVRELRRVDHPVDGGLSHSVLPLQQLDGLPQLVQLRVLHGGDDGRVRQLPNVHFARRLRDERFSPSAPPSR